MSGLRWLALGWAGVALALALLLHTRVGIVRDEVVYMDVAPKYADWWITLATKQTGVSEQSITAAFGGGAATDNNREHPPLMKTWMGFSMRFFGDTIEILDKVTAARLPTMVCLAILVALVVLWTGHAFGLLAAALAGGFALFMPRMLLHGQLATFDVPIAMWWVATLYSYWWARRATSRRSTIKWWLITGLALGSALGTKHNAVVLPVVMMTHTGWLVATQMGRDGQRWWRWPDRWLRGCLPIVPSLAVALATFVAMWPWLWLAPLRHAGEWLQFHVTHVHYNFEYLGKNWNHPPYPFHVPLITTLFVVPVTTLGAALVGTIAVWRKSRDVGAAAPAMLWFLSASFAIGPFLLTTTPIFGAEKHWAAAMPTLAVAAGVGASTCLAAIGRGSSWRAIATTLLSLAMLAGPVADALVAQPFALTHYNALAGGTAGGADLGMNRQFWGQAASAVVPMLRRLARADDSKGDSGQVGAPSQPIYTHDASPAWRYYLATGGLERFPDAGHEAVGIAKSQWAFVLHEKHFVRHDVMIWQAYGTMAPVWVLTAEGVPILSLYRRPPQPTRSLTSNK